MKITIASGKGGTGKTFISTNLFYILNKKNINVTLADCDAEEPNSMAFFTGERLFESDVTQMIPQFNEQLCCYCSKCADYCVYNAVFLLTDKRIIKVIADLCHGCGACITACRYGATTEKQKFLGVVSRHRISSCSFLVEGRMRVGAYTPVPIINATIKEAGNEGIVILDAPPGTSCPFIHTVASADYVILVTEPTPFGLSDLKISVEILKQLGKPFSVIINRAGLGNNDIYKYLSSENISVSMEIPFDKGVAELYSGGNIVAAYRRDIEEKFENLAGILTGGAC
jgi:MinD superfamily P-loop ATPase